MQLASDLSGITLGQFRLIEPLGAGGMAVVYRARQLPLRRDVAVKVLPPLFANQTSARERFRREAETAAALNHAHIVHIIDYGTDEGISYIAMQLLTGGSLADRLFQSAFTNDYRTTVSVLRQVAAALDYAHVQGVVHRDIKPSNILFDASGNCYVADFGIAKLLHETAAQLTGTGDRIGSPAYMAPEQWLGANVSPGTDQYALAVVAYQILTSCLPFRASNIEALRLQHLAEPPPLAYTDAQAVPEEASYVLCRALAKQPEARYESVTAFVQALENALLAPAERVPVAQPAPQPSHGMRSSSRRRRKKGIVFGGLLVIVMVVIAVSFATRIRSLLNAEAVGMAATNDPIRDSVATLDAQTATAIRAAEHATATRRSANATATATLWTATPTPNMTASIEAYLTGRAATATQEWIRSWTHTPTDTATVTPTATPVSNNNWEPVVQDFDGVEMVLVPAGCFMIGSKYGALDEQPVHEVCLDAFWIGQTEVTNNEYRSCVDAGQCSPPHRLTYYGSPDYADHPVVYIDWRQARDYATWVGGVLPTEAQWEYAARGPDSWEYPWGETFDCQLANIGGSSSCDGYSSSAPAGNFTGGASWVGALDMSGNVWEWTSTAYRDYPYRVDDGREDPDDPEAQRVVRGGSWATRSGARAAYRNWYIPNFRELNIGFRVVRVP